MFDPRKVLREYVLPPEKTALQPVQGGFSGAIVWKVIAEKETYALKAWPPGQPTFLALSEVHQRMQEARTAGHQFVPRAIYNRLGSSVTLLGNSVFELVTWQPGQAESGPSCSVARIQAAVKAVAQVHAVWRKSTYQRGICFGVQHRWQRLTEWTPEELEQLRQLAHQRSPVYVAGAQILKEQRERAMKQLASWLNRKLPLHFCLGDIWSDHVLFCGNQVTGIIDYGGMRLDHPAQDLARLLGSLCQDDARLRQAGLDAYQPASDELSDLAVILEKTGVIVGIGNWLRWLVLEKRSFADPSRAESRLSQLVQTVEERLGKPSI